MVSGHAVPDHRVRPRKIQFPFTPDIPRHWFAGAASATHVANGVNLLFPAGERFFVRSVKHYLHRFAHDPDMQAQIKGFFGQEGRHAHEHERFFEILEAQGYDIRPFLARYERVCFGVVEKLMPPALRLAVTAACEHFTAIMAENALEDRVFDQMHPVMRALLLWHASEEIEHKAVAFDVLRAVHPSYPLRVLGLACATALLGTWWLAATRMLLAQDRIPRDQIRRERAHMLRQRHGKTIIGSVFARGIRAYLRRDFHPWQNHNLHLAERYLASLEASLPS